MTYYFYFKVINYLNNVKIEKTIQAQNMNDAYTKLIEIHPDIKNIGLYHHIECNKIEVSYTGGGFWICETSLHDGTYATVDNDFINCLTVYKNSPEEEKYTPENMVFSSDKNELKGNYKKLYNALLNALRDEMKKYKG